MVFDSKFLRVAVTLAAGLLTSCATLNKSQCLTGDWTSIGLKDGTQGTISGERLADHSKACGKHGVSIDADQYKTGYTEGLNTYCTKDSGYTTGSEFGKNTFANKAYQGVCPTDLELSYLEGYLAGLKMNLEHLAKDLSDEEAELNTQRSAFLILKVLNSSKADGVEEDMNDSDSEVADIKSNVSGIITEVEKWLITYPELRAQMNKPPIH